ERCVHACGEILIELGFKLLRLQRPLLGCQIGVRIQTVHCLIETGECILMGAIKCVQLSRAQIQLSLDGGIGKERSLRDAVKGYYPIYSSLCGRSLCPNVAADASGHVYR